MERLEFAARRAPLDFHLGDAREGRTLPAPFEEPIERLPPAFGHQFDRAIGVVGHPSRQAQFTCPVRRAGAVPYPLHPAADDEAEPFTGVCHEIRSGWTSAA